MAESKHGKLTLMDVYGCAGGQCPSIYKDDEGRIFIQGYKVNPEVKTNLNVPDGEEIVELPLELLNALKKY